MQVMKGNLVAIGDAEAPVHSGWFLEAEPIGSATACSWINRLIVQIVRCARRLRQLFPRTGAGINKFAVTQLFPSRQMEFAPLALRVCRVSPSAVRTFIPVDAQPAQVFEQCC